MNQWDKYAQLYHQGIGDEGKATGLNLTELKELREDKHPYERPN